MDGGSLKGEGSYPAAIACHLTDPTTRKTIDYKDPIVKEHTKITEKDGECYITNVKNGSCIGYKYFSLDHVRKIEIVIRGTFKGKISVSKDVNKDLLICEKPVNLSSCSWTEIQFDAQVTDENTALYFTFEGEGSLDYKTLKFVV